MSIPASLSARPGATVITIVQVFTDCSDVNAKARLDGRLADLFVGVPIRVYGIPEGESGLTETALTVVDLHSLDTMPRPKTPKRRRVTLVNAAERNAANGHSNGTPFMSYEDEHGNLVVPTFDARFLADVARFGQVRKLRRYDIRTVMEWAVSRGLEGAEKVAQTVKTQFRSLEFQPYLAWLIVSYGDEVPHTDVPVPTAASILGIVSRIDNFGNAYTSATVMNLWADGEVREKVELVDGVEIPYFATLGEALAAGMTGELVAVTSSSGYGPNRVIMVCVAGLGGDSAAGRLGLTVGDPLIVVPQAA